MQGAIIIAAAGLSAGGRPGITSLTIRT